MKIDALKAIVLPPETPIETESEDKLVMLQDLLATSLPDDFYEFGRTYGSGTLVGEGIRLFVLNPFSPSYLEQVQERHQTLDGFKADEGRDYVPYDIFPETPGLFAWGDDINGNQLFWYTNGVPNDWSVVVRSEDGQFEAFNGSMSSFLVDALQHKIRVSIWPDLFNSALTMFRFEPDEPVIGQVSTRNIYQLYVDNGNNAGFWVRNIESQPGIIYFVKAVNGNQSGPLAGTPIEYGRPRVDIDVYINGIVLIQSDVNLLSAFETLFVRINVPVHPLDPTFRE